MGTKKGPPTRPEFSELTLEVRGIRKDLDGVRQDLDGLTRRVDAMGEDLGRRIDTVAAAVDHNTSVLKQVLWAVEVGNERRDGRVDGLERRVERLEHHAGIESPE